MTVAAHERIVRQAPIETWFGIGGAADAYAEPESLDEVRSLIETFEGNVRILGDGANLLVDDEGVDGVVLSLKHFKRVEIHDNGERGVTATVGAGTNLPRLIVDLVRDGLGGLECLGGIPATVGGAVRMNAGGAFGEISASVIAVRGVALDGQPFERLRDEIPFAYRHSGLEKLIITEVDIELTPGDATALRSRLKEVMKYKKESQPMAEKSAGCVFRNPERNGERISAGLLIDRAGCKGMRIGGAEVSRVHGNFMITHPGARAADVLHLIEEVAERVQDHSGIALDTEVVIWRRQGSN